MINKLLNYIDYLNNYDKPIKQRVQMMAIIIDNGRVLSVGHNNKNRLSFPFKNKNGYSDMSGIHAEMDAIRKVYSSILKGTTITIIGINSKSNNQVMSKPCKACLNAIKAVGIKKIIYFDEKGKKYIERVK